MAKADQKKRTALIAKALHIARGMKEQPKGKMQGRAEGGEVSFPDILARNPRGWGMGLPDEESFRSSGPSVSPRDISDVLGPFVGAGLEAGAPTLARTARMSPLDFAKDTAARELTPENALQVGLAAAPYERIPRALATAARYAPKMLGVLSGLGGSLAPTSVESGSDGPETEIARLEAAKAKAVAARDAAASQYLSASKDLGAELSGKGKTGKPGKGPTSDAIASQAKGVEAVAERFNDEIDTYDKRIKYLQHTMTPEYAQEQELIQKNIEARKPWYERPKIPGTDLDVPGLNTAMTWGPSVAAAALMRGKMNQITAEGAQILERIKTASNVGEEAAARVALDAWKRSAPKESVAALAETILLPGAVRTTGNIGDANFGPEVKDAQGNVLPGGAKQQAQEHVDRLMLRQGWKGLGEELIPQGLQGLEAAGAGALLAKRPPWGDVESQLSYLRGIKNPEATALEKITGGGGPRSMSPDQIALELVRRRLAAQGAESTLAGGIPKGPTPLWPQSMRGGPTNLTLPPPIARGPSDMSPLELAPPPTSSRTIREELQGFPTPATSQPAPSLTTPVPAALPDFSIAEETGASKLLRRFRKQGVNEWRHGDQTVLRHAEGKPEGGRFAPADIVKKAKTGSKKEATPKTDQGPFLDENGIPIKPDKDIDPNGPGNFRDGGMVQKWLGLARKYANGGVVGPVIGRTGGRTDALPVKVPAGAYVLPADFVSSFGGAEGNTLAGVAELDRAFGGQRASRASGGEVPIKISHGEYVLSPEQVQKIGNGDLNAGHRALDRIVLDTRRKHIQDLSSLPPPAK